MCKNKEFVALHNHSHYSTLDGFATIDEYIKAAIDNNMPGIGLADHGTASGLYKFISRAQASGLVPVPGIEFYVAPENPEGAKVQGPIYYGRGGIKAQNYDVSNGAYTHLTVFAYNNKGLENLFKLTSLSFQPENFYFKPRIDTNMLAEYSEGLIVTTGCPSSEVNKRFLLGQDEKAYEYANRLKSIFGENLYVELMDHKMDDEPLERILMPKLIQLSKDLDIKVIATNDSHYAFKENAEPHERILAVSTKSTMDIAPYFEGGTRFAFSTPEYYIKSYDEMKSLYPEDVAEEALANTVELMNKCRDIKLEYDPHLRPKIDIPEGYSAATYLQKLIYDGFKNKRGYESKELQEESVKRIQEEFTVLHSNDFIDYFLVVSDYINYAHKQGIGVGAGRGCFVPGSKVKANQGTLINIEDIKIGDKVQTHDTTYQIVEDTFIYDVVDEDMTKIILSNGKEINATSDHLIFHKEKGFIKAEEFIVGDVVLGPKDCVKSNLTKIPAVARGLKKGTERQKDADVKAKMSKSGYFTSYQQDELKIYYASSYELKALTILETDSTVDNFDRCMRRVPYIKPSTGLEHNYLPDIEVLNKDGSITIIEVKAEWQLKEKDTKAKLEQASDYFTNQGIDFQIWSETTFRELNDDWHNDLEIVSIEKYKYTGQVHDIQVANVHNYNVEGVTVHNSIGGSEIAYVLDISNTDPIRFDLLFERFLSPGRGSLYQIDYVSGKTEEIAVSDKKRIYSADGTDKVVYIHELTPGDTVNFENCKEVIKDVFVKRPGAAPDVDTDFHTEGREKVVQYCIDKYGKENVANIVTFGTFKAKRAFKAMCTVYNVPFSLANKASSFIPSGQGGEATLEELMDPTSPKYREGEDFRNAVENPIFKDVVEMAASLNGRISETGVHSCGLIISNQPLAGIIPTQVRQEDGKIITQWEYPELEALGLIKMDFLGLELIDTVQQTLENIELTNKSEKESKYIREVPNIDKLVKGEMNDPSTYKNLQEGNTVGIFQLGSPGVRDLLKRAKPTDFMDIATITALYRPGPMSMQSHNEWADRKNGVKDVVYIDEKLKGTVVQDILKDTQGLLVFQESLMQIATKYAGMTSYESDLLRKAMGKKKMDIMMSMKPKFIEGAIKNNSTKELAEKTWETMEGFASYGFNKCALGRTLVSTGDGKAKIENLYKLQEETGKDIYIESMFEDGSIKPHKIKRIVKSGRKPIYKVKTKNGKFIYITKEHRMLTTAGYGSIEDGKIALGKELIVDEEWNRRLSKKHIETKKNTMANLNKQDFMREQSRDWMTKYQSTLTFEDRSVHQKKISETSDRHEICLPIARAKLEQLRKNPEWMTEFTMACLKARNEKMTSNEYVGYGKPTQLSNGEWCDSMVEALAGEYLIERGIEFEMHKIVEGDISGGAKICDFYANGLYFEMDGLNRGREYFVENKYGKEIPFVYMTPQDFGDVIDEAIMTHHIENGDEIVEITAPKLSKKGEQYTHMTYDIEMDTSGPANFIANGMVSHNSHSVSYALNIYQSIYLKTHYPSEFMAALIQQGFGNPNNVRAYIQEAMRMKLKLGPVDINTSQVKMASTGVNPENEFNIVFGFSGVRQLNNTLAEAIVKERNENGVYTSVADFAKRISKITPLTASPLSNLALSGAFDNFGVSRKLVSDKAKIIIDSSVKTASKGLSLFDMVGGSSPANDVTEAIELTGEEFDFNEMIKLEAETIGMFISGHPTSKLGHIASRYNATNLPKIMSSGGSKETFTVLGTVTQLESKTTRAGNKSIAVLIDDGVGTAATYLPKTIVQAIEKSEEIKRLAKAKEKGTVLKPNKRSERLMELIQDESVGVMDPIELNEPYLFKIKTRGWDDNVNIVVIDIQKLNTAPDGSLPYEVYIPRDSMLKEIKETINLHKNKKVKKGAFVKVNFADGTSQILDTRVKLSIEFIMDMEKIVGKENIITEGI